MDPSRALNNIELIRSQVSETDCAQLDDELAGRCGRMAEATGNVAAASVVDKITVRMTDQDSSFTRYLDGETRLDVHNQLSIMCFFWDTLGYKMPELSFKQQTNLRSVMRKHPTHRLIAAPLLDIEDRIALADEAQAVYGSSGNFSANSPLYTADKNWLYGRLLLDPQNILRDVDDKDYGLRYKTAGSLVTVSRRTYISDLVSTGHAIEDEQGIAWTLSVTDVSTHAPRTRDCAGNLYSRVSGTQTPESLIVMRLLHQVSGTQSTDWEADFANEAVFELDRNGNALELVNLASVGYNPETEQIELVSRRAIRRNDHFGVRAEESGL